MKHTFRLIFDCPDTIGIVAAVSQLLAENGSWISESAHHSDHDNQWFFSRMTILADSLPFGCEQLKAKLAPIATKFKMHWKVIDSKKPKKVVLMVSKSSHCLADLLDRWKSNDLEMHIAGVISNHDDLRSLVEWYGLPYYHIPIDKHDKQSGFAEQDICISTIDPECIVLARYMQILPTAFCQNYTNRIINIHHSFLPSFVGAKPYHQASERGVKLIGATCHYVTEALDQGPIIDQDVVRVSHCETKDDLVRLGKDVEKTVLARGLRAHLEDRILVHGNKTVVFR